MCQYFWWTCEICSLPQDYVLYCSVGLTHSPCQSYKKPELLPLVIPYPICRCCGQAGRAKRAAYAVPLRSQNTRQDEILPELRAILNDDLFWINPALRLPNSQEIAAKYDADRKKRFGDVERERKKLGPNVDNDQKRIAQEHNVLEAAWMRLRVAMNGTRANVIGNIK